MTGEREIVRDECGELREARDGERGDRRERKRPVRLLRHDGAVEGLE